MTKRKKNDLSMPVSWRSLKPSSSSKSSSSIAARKKLLILSRFFLVLSSVVVLAFLIHYQFNQSFPSKLYQRDFAGIASPVDRVLFRSDGALSQKWFLNWIGPLRGLSLAEIDLKKLHQSLLDEDQILSATVERKFPSTLKVLIKERDPLLVLRLGREEGGFQDWLVSSDGSLYQGTGYSPSTLKHLPSLQVSPSLIQKKSNQDGYERLMDMPSVSPLLELARIEYPEIYRDWRVVSYNRPTEKDPGANITIKSKRVGSIRFNPSDYATQLKRLRYMLEEPRFTKAPFIHSIDLSHGRSVFAKI